MAHDFLKNSAIIVAHPDDEILWFGAIAPHVDQIIIAYENFWAQPNIGAQRAEALARFPRQVESLRIDEAGTYGFANWQAPEPDAFGLGFSASETVVRGIKCQMKMVISALTPMELPRSENTIRATYEANFQTLYDRLKPRLTADMNVFTHNPWGEYGHEDHVQMFRVLDLLRHEIGFKLWMSNYCTERSLPLAMHYFDASPKQAISLPVDKKFCQSIAEIYMASGCWTWDHQWAWFDTEHYLPAPTNGPTTPQAHRHLFPLNLFQIC